MKKITKIISLSLAMMLVLASFASCGLVEDTATVEKASAMESNEINNIFLILFITPSY